jgi:putative cell wall-binding protein
MKSFVSLIIVYFLLLLASAVFAQEKQHKKVIIKVLKDAGDSCSHSQRGLNENQDSCLTG